MRAASGLFAFMGMRTELHVPGKRRKKKRGWRFCAIPFQETPRQRLASRGRHCTRPEAWIHEADPWLLVVDQAVLLEMKYASYENNSQ